jgi:hypothetical protein
MNRKPQSIFIPILVWSALQIISLSISAARVQLWARMISPAENYALQLMLAVQVIAAAMIFPWLMRDARSSAFVILIAAPFLQLAGMLGERSGSEIAWTIFLAWTWLITLALWRTALRGKRAEMIGVAVASCMTIGSACVWYLQNEFADYPFSQTVIYVGLIALSIIAAATALVIHFTSQQVIHRVSTNDLRDETGVIDRTNNDG